MKKRILAVILMLTILMTNNFSALAYYRENMTKPNSTDSLEYEEYEVYDFDTQKKTVFSYDVPEDGATVLIFFSPGCPNSQALFKNLNDCPWLDSEYVNVVAVESKDTMSRSDTVTFLNTYVPKQKDNITVFYDNDQLQWEYLYQTSFFTGGLTWPLVLVITETGENRVIRYAEEALTDSAILYKTLCSVSEKFADSEPVYSESKENPAENEGVLVSVAGWHYDTDEASELYDLIQEFRTENGLPEFEFSYSVRNFANLRSQELLVDYGTTRPNGENWSDLEYNKGKGIVDAEFIAIGHTDPKTVLENWLSDEAHRNYLLETKADTMGISCCITENTMSWAVVFGTDNADVASALDTSAHHLVEVQKEKLEPVQETYDIMVGIDETASFNVKYKNQGAEFAPSVLVPEVSDVYDSSGNLIARLSVNGQEYYGLIEITPVAIGQGSVELPVYDGQDDPVVLNLTVDETGRGSVEEETVEEYAEAEEYNIEVIASGPGTAYAAVDSAKEGQKVVLTVIPDEGCEVSHCVTSSGGSMSVANYLPESIFEQVNSYTYTFLMPDGDFEVDIDFEESGWWGGFEPEEHYHEYIMENWQAATCVEEGYTGDWVCKECGELVIEGEKVELTAHHWDSYILTKASTCQTEGVIRRDCTFCDEFQMLSIGTLGAGFPGELNNPFTDVKKGSYYFDSVLWAVGRDITSGTSATTFTPNGTCTRAQIVTFLWRADGSPEPKMTESPFTDVAAGSYYEKAVLWAVEQGITSGMTETTFGPNEPCTRAHVVTFIHRWQGEPESTLTEYAFTDVKQGDYYYEAMLWAVEEEITVGMTATTFGPKNPCTRAQIVTFLRRTMIN